MMAGSKLLPKVAVWDWPVRVCHWLLVLCFAGAYWSSDSEQWRLLHVTLGYTLGALVIFRLVWGVLGTTHARFASFVAGPGAVWRYLQSLLRRQPLHFTGHNPAGSWAIVLLLASGLALLVTGWGSYNDVGGDNMIALHAFLGNAMLGVVVVHLAGVVVSSGLHRENLVRAMVTGRKRGEPQHAIAHSRGAVAAVLLLVVLVYWALVYWGVPSWVPPAVAHWIK